MQEPKWQYHFKRVIKFLNDKNWNVILGKVTDDECNFFNNTISVRTVGRRTENSLYILLHETGHILFSKRSGDYLQYAKELNINKGSQAYKVLEVEEEFEAWKQGYDLAISMGIPINKKNYETIKARYLATYMMSAMERKVKNEILNGIKKDRVSRLTTQKKALDSNTKERRVINDANTCTTTGDNFIE